MAVYCGIDWAEGHHDIALVDDDGRLVASGGSTESLDGLAELTAMLAAAGDSAEAPIPVAIETPRGLLVAVLRATGRPIYPINPLAVARYRERTSVSGKKSDHVDAMALANILRTDAHLHRMLPDDSRAGPLDHRAGPGLQDAVWRRTKLVQELRARLREYYPGFLAAFGSRVPAPGRGHVDHPAGQHRRARGAGHRPSPAEGLTVSRARVEKALRRGGRQRRSPPVAARDGRRAAHPAAAPGSAWSSRRCAPRRWRCSACWTRSATRSTSSPRRWWRRSRGTRTIRSSPASRAGRHQRRDRARRDRRRPGPVRRRPCAAGLRRLGTGYPRLGQVAHRHPATHEEQPARRASATRGRSPPPPAHPRPASTTCAAATAAMGTRPRCGTCSTGCSANCTTACAPAQTYDPSKAFPHRPPRSLSDPVGQIAA